MPRAEPVTKPTSKVLTKTCVSTLISVVLHLLSAISPDAECRWDLHVKLTTMGNATVHSNSHYFERFFLCSVLLPSYACGV